MSHAGGKFLCINGSKGGVFRTPCDNFHAQQLQRLAVDLQQRRVVVDVRCAAHKRHILQKRGPFFEFSLCFSRACLGKMIGLYINGYSRKRCKSVCPEHALVDDRFLIRKTAPKRGDHSAPAVSPHVSASARPSRVSSRISSSVHPARAHLRLPQTTCHPAADAAPFYPRLPP